MSGRITINTERCKGCGLCVAVCPRNSIVISKNSNGNGYFPAQAADTDCTGCAACAIVCPDAVIEVHRDDPANIKTIAGPKNKSRVSLVEEKA
ncbi:MAG: ferredoxin family protein [Phycisphaerales bacterium]|nr:MAG: ferredoxin family protein [Phycisphaerales bacterium]